MFVEIRVPTRGDACHRTDGHTKKSVRILTSGTDRNSLKPGLSFHCFDTDQFNMNTLQQASIVWSSLPPVHYGPGTKTGPARRPGYLLSPDQLGNWPSFENEVRANSSRIFGHQIGFANPILPAEEFIVATEDGTCHRFAENVLQQ